MSFDLLSDLEASKNELSQTSGLDMLNRAEELNDEILELIYRAGVTPLLAMGVLESVKAQILYHMQKRLQMIEDEKKP